MLEMFMVAKKNMHVAGEVRSPGDLIPEATDFTARAKQRLQDSGELIRVVVVSTREYKKLEGALSAPE